MSDTRGVFFHRAMTPYEAGDIVGLPAAKAADLVNRGIASYHPPVVPASPRAPDPLVMELLAAMNRAELVAFGQQHLGLAGDPPASTTDDELRAAILAGADGEAVKAAAAVKAAIDAAGKGGKAK